MNKNRERLSPTLYVESYKSGERILLRIKNRENESILIDSLKSVLKSASGITTVKETIGNENNHIRYFDLDGTYKDLITHYGNNEEITPTSIKGKPSLRVSETLSNHQLIAA